MYPTPLFSPKLSPLRTSFLWFFGGFNFQPKVKHDRIWHVYCREEFSHNSCCICGCLIIDALVCELYPHFHQKSFKDSFSANLISFKRTDKLFKYHLHYTYWKCIQKKRLPYTLFTCTDRFVFPTPIMHHVVG